MSNRVLNRGFLDFRSVTKSYKTEYTEQYTDRECVITLPSYTELRFRDKYEWDVRSGYPDKK